VLLASSFALVACPSTGESTASETDPATATMTEATESTGMTGTETDDPGSVCDLTECINRVQPTCGEEDYYCTLACDDEWPCTGPELCPLVRIKSIESDQENYHIDGPIEDATCMLTKLRDREPGRLHLDWGDLQGFYLDDAVKYYATIDIVPDGGVLIWWYESLGGGFVGERGKSRKMELMPVEYFDTCLGDPTEENLIACIIGEVTVAKPAPEGYVPPWLTGMCSEEEPSCS